MLHGVGLEGSSSKNCRWYSVYIGNNHNKSFSNCNESCLRISHTLHGPWSGWNGKRSYKIAGGNETSLMDPNIYSAPVFGQVNH